MSFDVFQLVIEKNSDGDVVSTTTRWRVAWALRVLSTLSHTLPRCGTDYIAPWMPLARPNDQLKNVK